MLFRACHEGGYELGKTYHGANVAYAYANALSFKEPRFMQRHALLEVRLEGVTSRVSGVVTGKRMTVVRKLSAEEICTAWTGNLVHEDGTQRWFRNGELHREGDLPAVIRADGSQRWFLNGVFVK